MSWWKEKLKRDVSPPLAKPGLTLEVITNTEFEKIRSALAARNEIWKLHQWQLNKHIVLTRQKHN